MKIKNINRVPPNRLGEFGLVCHRHSLELVEFMDERSDERDRVSAQVAADHAAQCGCGESHDLGDTAGQTVLVGALCGLIMSHEPEQQVDLLVGAIALLAARVAPDGAGALLAIMAASKKVTEMFPGPRSTMGDVVEGAGMGLGPRGPLGPLDIN